MEKQDHILKPDQRVRLRDGYDHFYQFARSGAQGVVKAIDYDPLGYPFALIEWDENHWTYEGEQSGWAYQTHFEPVEESMGKEKESTTELSPELLAKIAAVVKAMQDGDDPVVSENAEEIRLDEEFVKAVEHSISMLEKSEALLVIAVRRVSEDGGSNLIPDTISYSRTPEGTLALEAQIGHLLQVSHNSLILERLEEINKAGKDDE